MPGLIRRPQDVTRAIKAASDTRAFTDERQGSIGFLLSYGKGDDPDQATAGLRWMLEESPPDYQKAAAKNDLGKEERGGLR